MKEVECVIPIAGCVYVTVMVDDDATEDEIFNAAVDDASEMNRDELESVTEWGYYKHITQGRVLNASHNDFSYEVVDEDA